MVGIMLPASVGGVLANIATLLAGKVPVNLNFTAGPDAVETAMEQCGIRTVLTSRVFLAKAKLDAPRGAVYLEDVLKSLSKPAKVWAAVRANLGSWRPQGTRSQHGVNQAPTAAQEAWAWISRGWLATQG